jgi:hypothetical protein
MTSGLLLQQLYIFLMFLWPCILIYSCKENQLEAQFIPSIFHQSTSTCFGCIYSPSSGGTPYIYNNWHLLFLLTDWLLSWLGYNSSRTTDYTINTPETCRGWLTKYTEDKQCIKLVFFTQILYLLTKFQAVSQFQVQNFIWYKVMLPVVRNM